MKLGRREMLVAAAAAVITLVGLVAAGMGSIRLAIAAVLVLLFGSVTLQVLALRQVAIRQASLDRVEQKLDVVARRVITEAEATGRELGGQIDALAAELKATRRELL